MKTTLFIKKNRIRTDSKTKLFLRLTDKKERCYYDTGFYIPARDFNFKKKELKIDNDIKDYTDKLLLKIEKILIDCRIENEQPNIKLVLHKLNHPELKTINNIPLQTEPFKSTENPIQLDFFKVFDKYVKSWEQLKDKKQSTINKYKDLKKTLLDFELKKFYQITFDNINKDFYDLFIEWLYENGLTDNSVDTYIKNLKCILNITYKDKIHNNISYLSFTRKRYNGDIITLSYSDVIKTLEYKPTKEIYKPYYDTYLVHLSTGLRVDDLLKLTSTNVIIDYTLGDILSRKRAHVKLFMGKTNKPLIIPLSKICYDVFLKYKIPLNDLSFNKLNIQSYNNFLRMMCKDLKLNTPVRKTMYRGKQPIIIEKPLHELISSHTIRKTFISLSLKQNNPAKVMDVSGHSDYASFKRYINLDMTDKSDVVNTLDNVYSDLLKEKEK